MKKLRDRVAGFIFVVFVIVAWTLSDLFGGAFRVTGKAFLGMYRGVNVVAGIGLVALLCLYAYHIVKKTELEKEPLKECIEMCYDKEKD